jgi:predicted amidohydrolase YtcJ
MPAVTTSAPEANLILEGGRIWTGDPETPWAEAIAVKDDRILAVGSREEIERLSGASTRRVDLGGGLALPGFIDSHVHFMSGGFQLLSVNLRHARSPVELATLLEEFAGRLGSSEWITGGDWDHEAWQGAELPNRNQIDAATPENPVFVQRLDGHMALANSLALMEADIDRTTADPPGGTIVKDPGTGEPTGVLKDAAMDLVRRVIPRAGPEARLRAARAALAEAARLGVTTVHDISSFEDLRTYQTLSRGQELTARIYAITPLPEWKTLAAAGIEAPFGDHRIQIGAVKGFVDGSLGSTTALFFEPYSDAPGTSGIPNAMMFPEGNMKRLVTGADEARLQLAIHAIGDRANGILLDLFEAVVSSDGRRDRRFRIEHAQHLRSEQISRMARLGVIASMQPYHAIDDGRWAEKRIGPERVKLTYAFRSLLDAGVRLAFGSDWTVAPLNPLLGIDAAVTRRTLDGKNPEGWIPEQKITLEEALVAYTAGGAYASFAENHKGMLRAGFLADIAVLQEDLFAIPVERIRDVKVTRTFVGGRQVFPATESSSR